MNSEKEKLIVEKLMAYKKGYAMISGNAFTNNPEAEQFIKQD